MAINRWTEEQTKRALYLYFQLPFGQINYSNHEIIALANELGRSPSSIAMKLANFASLDPKITESGRKGLTGATALDRQIWAQFNGDWTRLIAEAEKLGPVISDIDTTVSDIDRNLSDVGIPFKGQPRFEATTVTALVELRVGQNFFRRAVLANYDNCCCVTGIADTRLLNASHIRPWSIDETNRHNPKNGLCLSATFDRAFDRGLMGVDGHGRARFSKVLLQSSSVATRSFFQAYDGKPLTEAVRFDPDPSFLKWHHDHFFNKGI